MKSVLLAAGTSHGGRWKESGSREVESDEKGVPVFRQCGGRIHVIEVKNNPVFT